MGYRALDEVYNSELTRRKSTHHLRHVITISCKTGNHVVRPEMDPKYHAQLQLPSDTGVHLTSCMIAVNFRCGTVLSPRVGLASITFSWLSPTLHTLPHPVFPVYMSDTAVTVLCMSVW